MRTLSKEELKDVNGGTFWRRRSYGWGGYGYGCGGYGWGGFGWGGYGYRRFGFF